MAGETTHRLERRTDRETDRQADTDRRKERETGRQKQTIGKGKVICLVNRNIKRISNRQTQRGETD